MFDKEEILRTVSPSKDILCKDCAYRLKPVTFMGQEHERHTYGECIAFEQKPSGVLWKSESCELYRKDG